MLLLSFVFFIWLMILTLSYFFIWRSSRKLEKQIWELKKRLHQLQQNAEAAPKAVEKEEAVIDPVKKDEKQISQFVDQPAPQKEEDLAVSKPNVTQKPPSTEISKKEPVNDQPIPKKTLAEQSSRPLGGDVKDPKRPTSQEKKRRRRIDWELLIGGRWLNRIGALAIIIGLIFFIKYAFDHDLISHQMKVMFVVLVGFSFLWGGRYFHRKQLPIFAQGLIGAGVATLYLSVYAAHNFYYLISGSIAFLLMSLVTILAFQQAMTYHALAISLLGWCGGYLTPFLVSVSEASTIGLFTYLAFLSLGMILVAIKKRNWSILYHLTLMATYLIFFFYLLVQPEPSEWLLRIGFLMVFWSIFYGYELYYLTRQSQWPMAKEVMAVVHSMILYVGWVWLLHTDHSSWILESLTITGLAYLVPLVVQYWRKRLSQVFKQQVIRHGITFSVFINIAPLYHWERYELILVWIIQAALLVGWATQKRLQWLINYTLGFLGVVSFTLILLSLQYDHHWPIFNLEFLSYLGLTGVFLFGAIRVQQKTIIKSIFHVSWATISLIGFSVEISTLADYIQRITAKAYSDEVTFLYGLVLFVGWILYSLLLTRIAIRKQIRSLMVTSWVFLALGTLYFSVVSIAGPLENITFVFLSRVPIFFMAMIALYFHYRWHRNSYPTVARVCLFGGILLGFEFLTLHISDFFDYHLIESSSHAERSLIYTKWNVLWMAWLLYSLLLIWYGWKRNISSLIRLSTIFYSFCIVGVFMQGMKFKPISQFVPVWNHRLLMFLIAAFVSYGFYYLFQKKEKKKRIGFLFILILLLFECTHMEINDYFRYQLFQTVMTDTLQTEAIQFTQPLSLATIWVLFSVPLMWLGLRYQRRWMQTIAWMVFVIGLFFVMIGGLAYSPIVHFIPLLNRRSLFLLIAVAVLFLHLAWFKKISNVRLVCSILITILLFELITVEVNDLFRLLIDQDQRAIYELINLKQLSFSFAWIMYAIFLIVIGLWRKFPSLRWIAIGLFGVSIFKIFLYDLAYLDTLYRIFLFIGLGVVLLIVSYIYQRYKHLFVDTND